MIRSLAFWARARDPVWSFANLGACLGSLSLGAQEPPWWVTEPPLSPSSCPSSLSRRTGSCAVCASRGHPWLTLHGGVLGLCRLEPSLSVCLSVCPDRVSTCGTNRCRINCVFCSSQVGLPSIRCQVLLGVGFGLRKVIGGNLLSLPDPAYPQSILFCFPRLI